MRKNKTLLLTLLGLLMSLVALADEPFRNHRYDAFHELKTDTNSVLFVGNSITNMHEWWEAFGCQQNIQNRGTSGGYTDEVITHLSYYLQGQPAAIFLMIGTNDLGTNGKNTTQYVLNNMKTIMTRVRKESPRTKLYVQSILPSNTGLRTTTLLKATNDAIRAEIEKNYPEVTYIDLWDDLIQVADAANGNLTADGLHLKAEGYRIWCNRVLPYVQLYCPEARVVYPANTATAQQTGGLGGSWGMRVTYFSQLPVHQEDILVLGDETVHSGEWHELLGSAHIKNRGTGWGLGSCSIAQATSEIPAILSGRAKASDNEAPRQIYTYLGYSDVIAGGMDEGSAVTAYRSLIAKIRQYAPAAKTHVYVMGLVPHRNESVNNRILSYNFALKMMARDMEGVTYVNTHTPLMEGTKANTQYVDGNGYLTGKGYLQMASIMARTMQEATELNPILKPKAASLGHLLPQPQQYQMGEGSVDAASLPVTTQMVTSIPGTYDYVLEGYDNEAYTLTIAPEGIQIQAVSEMGAIRARQTLAQLVEEYGTAVPCVSITDWPAFKLRGLMHDVGRSFISYEELKHEIELLASFKMNTLHWHLTDNQGFRFQSLLYPQLNADAAFSRYAGQYYTQEQCRELEAFARERGVIIIPEIDMPGHSQAFRRAMGFEMSSAQGKAVLKELLGELSQAFPLAPYIHMGADEAGTTAAFVNEMSGYIQDELHRRVVVWNPISGVSISTGNLPHINMTSMWSTSGRKIAGIPNIDSRYNYINHFDVFADLVGIYKSNVYYEQQGNSEVAGAICAVWNDRKTPTEQDIIRQNNVWANTLATVERCWQGGGRQYIEQGGTTLPNSGAEMEEFRDFEDRLLWHKEHSLAAEPIPYVRQCNVRWRITDAFPNEGDRTAVFPPEECTQDVMPESYTYEGRTYSSRMATGAGIYLRHTWGTQVPGFYQSPANNSTAYAWTYVYSPVEQQAGALIELQNYGRSENDAAPDQGCWDRKGSRIWLNGQELMPPTWQNAGRGINSEVDLRNENFTARAPQIVTLHQGWNKVLLKLPYVSASGIRLNKWMFTFVLTDTQGRNALDGLIYSPDQYSSDEAEELAALASEITQYVQSRCQDGIGYYPASLATDIMATVDQVKATLTQELSSEQRSAQMEAMNEAFDNFRALLSSAQVNQPATVDAQGNSLYYTLRDHRLGYYTMSQGSGKEVMGNGTRTATSYWRFVPRTDGTYDIQNYVDRTYISPTASNNSALTTTKSRPAAGWQLRASDCLGYVIITSGSAQLNQTQAGQGYKVYNWGSGNNTNDTGCQFLIAPATDLPELDENGNVRDPWDGRLVTLTNIQQDGTERTLMVSTKTGKLAFSKWEPERIGATAQFRCTLLTNGMYTLLNEGTGLYLIWRGSNSGYNDDAGLLDSYRTPWCDWAIYDGSSALEGTHFMVSKRADGVTDGSLILSSTGSWDAYGASIGYTATYSNLFRIAVAQESADAVTAPTQESQTPGHMYDLSGRRVERPRRGLYISQGRKVVIP